MMQTHVLYTGGTLGMVSTPNGLAPGADLTGWLNQLLSGTELAGTFETLSFEHLIDSANATPDDWRRIVDDLWEHCLLYTSPSPRDLSTSRMPSSA